MSENGLHSIPPILILKALRDNILKGLDKKLAKKFSIQFEKAISVEADLSEVYNKWVVRLLKRIRVYASDDGRIAIDKIIWILEKDSEWHNDADAPNAAATTTNDAAYAAVMAALYAAVMAALALADDLADDRVDDAARSAAIISTYAADAARSGGGVDGFAAAGAEIEKQRDDLLEIVKEIWIEH